MKQRLSENDMNVYVTDKQASEMMNIPIQTLRNWRFNGRGPTYRKLPGTRLVRYCVADIERYMADGLITPKN